MLNCPNDYIYQIKQQKTKMPTISNTMCYAQISHKSLVIFMSLETGLKEYNLKILVGPSDIRE